MCDGAEVSFNGVELGVVDRGRCIGWVSRCDEVSYLCYVWGYIWLVVILGATEEG